MKIRLPRRFLYKMILFCLLVGTLPLIFLGVFSYYKASQTIEKKVLQGNMQILTQIHSRVEQVLKNVDNSVTQFVNSSFVNQAMNKSLSVDDFQTVDQLLTDLYYFQTFELGVQNVSLINFNREWVLSGGGVSRFDKGQVSPKISEYRSSPLLSTWETEDYYDSYISSDDPKAKKYYSVNLVKKVPINSPDPIGLAIARIPTYELNKNLIQNADLGEFLILDRNYQIIAHSDSSMIGEDVSQAPYMGKLIAMNSPQGYFEDGHTGISFRKSDYNGWVYISLVSITAMNKESREIGWLTLITTLISICVICIISYKGSQKMYNPIRKLHTMVADGGEGSERETIDEIESIGYSIQHMKQTQTKISNQLQEQIPQLTYFFVLRLFQGELADREIKDKLPSLNGASHWKTLHVIAVQIDSLEKTRYEEKDKDILMYAVNNIVSELIPVHNRLNPIVMGDSLVTLYGTMKEDVELIKTEVNELTRKIQKSVGYYLELPISIGISKPYHEFNATPRAYHEALEALKYRVEQGQPLIVSHDEMDFVESNKLSYPVQIEQELLDAVKAMDKERIQPLLHQFMEALTAERMNIKQYELSLVRLLVSVVRFVQDSGHSKVIWTEDEKSLLNQLLELKNLHEIEKWFHDIIIEPIIDHLSDSKEDHYKKIIEQVVHIIEENYNKDVTLEMCAAALNYHPYYISKVFRSQTGVTFSDYLHKFRMDMAKKWLVDTDMRINEIAKQLGFYNAQNFIRSFRKLEGLTPGRYRELYSKL
ncbi:helix-turn-helix domain-containing protein [Paenibacillus radicis (ex Xue et al. 2023)]|uniref:Helix-turn-helix domain-containing protein n=1 Tax=Paenibacillus radicis (ex Xue et al. 2023) TaxID=2972489 RepID=A0ABT1Y9H4_9BACL|nr:helix-turn-helix domain-containing protein [Paenibacillus radicis (ex Xue et al. 2023)]MCR8629845.1 helix-turn-helix domain-containing protein [Paenibacillus radicis (ex Xue et al. 2023)]